MADDLLERCASLAAATVYEANEKHGAVGPDVHAITCPALMVGYAATIRCWPGDALGLWKAVSRLKPDEVLVADMGASKHVTALGDSTVQAAIARRAAGIVTNCSVRDTYEIRRLGLPVFAAGINLAGTQKQHQGWLNVPVVIGNAVVNPGDLVVGDEDGVIVVARSEAERVVEQALARLDEDRQRDRRLAAGEDPMAVLGLAE